MVKDINIKIITRTKKQTFPYTKRNLKRITDIGKTPRKYNTAVIKT